MCFEAYHTINHDRVKVSRPASGVAHIVRWPPGQLARSRSQYVSRPNSSGSAASP
uniref:Uncharacterized protein n=1 Tax=Leptobrachium leishanense TaxID=445787 RepID=A0A8C5QTP0_9ANUR